MGATHYGYLVRTWLLSVHWDEVSIFFTRLSINTLTVFDVIVPIFISLTVRVYALYFFPCSVLLDFPTAWSFGQVSLRHLLSSSLHVSDNWEMTWFLLCLNCSGYGVGVGDLAQDSMERASSYGLAWYQDLGQPCKKLKPCKAYHQGCKPRFHPWPWKGG